VTELKVGIIPSENDTQYCLNKTYVNWVNLAYGVWPILIFAPSQVAGLDVLVLPGGVDIDPTLFGDDNYASYSVNTDQDILCGDCIDEAIAVNVPQIYGICKGLQYLAYKFLLNKDFPKFTYSQSLAAHNQGDLRVPRTSCSHRVVDTTTGIVKYVNSMHHQALLVDKTALKEGKYLKIISHYTFFGAPEGTAVVEGIDFKVGRTQITGVQWHPEELSE